MTERDLLDFIVQEKKLKKLLDYYKELGDKMSLPKSPNLASIPGGGGDGEERLDLIMDRRTHIKGKIDECRILRDLAEKKLDRAAEILVDELQIDVFDLLYRQISGRGKHTNFVRLLLAAAALLKVFDFDVEVLVQFIIQRIKVLL